MNNNEKYPSNSKVVVQKSVKSGLSFGTCLAMIRTLFLGLYSMVY
ncbi:hypothetical protein [Paraclostridium sordellii]|nr:hypothetical protein [Paeniclostridium sordellii]EPZ55985.1 putative membrane protein [[Clostridium] sordellii VPI 9048] [Paeniclostridium sordellii VPI 9048]CEK38277.1 putative membrane protein [[Clostridium] sordellii] [Paeniclostridium sordellii]